MAILGPLLIGVLLLLVGLVGAALALACGSLLSRVFAVSVWEATIVVLVVAAGALRAFWALTPEVSPIDLEPEEAEEPDEPAVVVRPDLSWRPGRRNRRRRN